MENRSLLERILMKIGRLFIWSPDVRNELWKFWCIITRKKARETKKDKQKYKEDIRAYKRLNSRKNFDYNEEYAHPCLFEWRGQAGYPGSYFWQDLWGAMKIQERMPEEHFDIGSRIDGFISHLMLLKNVKITLIDIRPLDREIPGVNFLQGDATDLKGIADNSIASLSALCSLEHFGLGRYGDDIDPEACFKAFKAIQRVIKQDGYIYISVPIGKERVCFNAHRIFFPSTIIEAFDSCILEEFSVLDMYKEPILRSGVGYHDYDEYVGGGVMGLFVFRKK